MAQLPTQIDPFQLAKQKAQLTGHISLKQMPRLKPVTLSQQGAAEIQLDFGQDDYGEAVIHGRIAAVLELECQRCGKPAAIPVAVELCLYPIKYEAQMATLKQDQEPLITHDEPVKIVDLVEEELLLSLPMVVKHDEAACNVHLPEELVC